MWELTLYREEPFNIATIDNILEENARQKAEIKWLNDVINNNISNLNAVIQEVNNRATETETTLGSSIQDNSDLIDNVNGRVTSNKALILLQRFQVQTKVHKYIY